MKKTWLIALAVVALAALGIGFAVPAMASGNGNSPVVTTPAIDTTATTSPAVVRVADALGLTPTELLTKLQSGETLAQIAADQGVTTDTVIDALVAPYADALNTQVTNGSLTQEEADALLQTARDNAASFLTQELSDPGAFSTWHEEMEQYCDQYMLGAGNRYGMMEGWNGGTGNGYGFGPGTCMGAWDDGDAGNGAATQSQYGTGNRFGGNGFGGGMMGGRGFGGGMMSW